MASLQRDPLGRVHSAPLLLHSVDIAEIAALQQAGAWGAAGDLKLGAGGMGEVYRAHDEQLDRECGAREFEPDVWLDFAPAADDRPRFAAYSVAFEYGVTKHWMVDGFAGWIDPAGEDPTLHRLRAETRVRFGEEGDRHVDLAASFEIEYEKQREPPAPVPSGRPEVEKDLSLTPRLVLSRDLPHELNVTLNLDLARELRESLLVPQMWFSFPPSISCAWCSRLSSGLRNETPRSSAWTLEP